MLKRNLLDIYLAKDENILPDKGLNQFYFEDGMYKYRSMNEEGTEWSVELSDSYKNSEFLVAEPIWEEIEISMSKNKPNIKGKVVNASYLYANMPYLKAIDISRLCSKKNNLTSIRGLFSGNPELYIVIGLDTVLTEKIEDLGRLFYGCDNLSDIYIRNKISLNIESEKLNQSQMFGGVNNLRPIHIQYENQQSKEVLVKNNEILRKIRYVQWLDEIDLEHKILNDLWNELKEV